MLSFEDFRNNPDLVNQIVAADKDEKKRTTFFKKFLQILNLNEKIIFKFWKLHVSNESINLNFMETIT